VAAERPSFARAAAHLVEAALLALPPRVLLRLAEGIGTLAFRLSPGRRRIACENLRIAFGDALDESARVQVARRAFAALVRVFAEGVLARRLLATPHARSRRLRFRGDWDRMRSEAAGSRGGIVVTAHLGNWEVGALAARHRGVPLRAVARPVGRPVLDALLVRGRGGADRVIAKSGGLGEVVGTLGAGGWVALLADQNAGRHGVFAPFFGLDAATFPTAATLAARLGVPVYLGVSLRRPGVLRFDVHLERLPAPAAGIPRAEAVEAWVRGLNRRVEAWVREAPEQYHWAHRRWKTRPPGRDEAEPGRPFYARTWPHPPERSRARARRASGAARRPQPAVR
jgi:lauroyl/myristoyl acyltransferase